ncbi:hypothetical protein [Thermococcus peptonophilus]|uniref:hypothetical protein n=1 Tax=Thermococcus peptonophilus TaxID=53952 RepID=UPI000A510131
MGGRPPTTWGGIPSDSVWHHNGGAIGSVFAVLFGYSTSMEWGGRVLVQFGYLLLGLYLVLRAYGKEPSVRPKKANARSAS